VGDFQLEHSFKESAVLPSDMVVGGTQLLGMFARGMMGAAAGGWACRLRLNHLQFRSRSQEVEIIIFAFGT
jgi:hypothetical protein